MNTLKLKSILFGLIAFFAVAIVMTSCEQDPLENITEETLEEMASQEKRTDVKLDPASEEDYIEGQLYVKLKDDYNTSFKSTSRDVDLTQLPFLNTLKSNHNFAAKSTFYFSKSAKLNRTLRLYLDDATQTDALISELKNSDAVEYVERVAAVRSFLTPNDLGANTNAGQYGLHKVQAQQAWDITQGSSSVVVAIVDDAISTTHSDLVGKMVAGRDVSDDDNDTNPAFDYFPHGTHVAGIAGAKTNNGTGISSIGYNVKIMPVKASPDSAPAEAYCSYNCVLIYDAYEGVAWAASNGADVINMSWGSIYYNQTAENIISDAAAQGAVLVAAAGNNNSSSAFYPASYANVISVGGTDINDNKYADSNYGSTIDVAAPAVSIRSTVISGGYENWNGTSMASPLVAGLCGLVLSVDPTLSPAEVENCIKSTADPLSSSFQLGAGRVNALKAVQCATPDNGSDCDAPAASDLTFGVQTTLAYVYAFPYQGITHQIRYRAGGGSWTTFNATTSHYNTINNIQDCTTYEAQIRQKCGNIWSNWSASATFTTGPATPAFSDLTTPTVGCNYVHTYCYNNTDDQKLFQLRKGDGTFVKNKYTTTHYRTFTGLTPNTQYKYRVKKRCGTSGTWSGWTGYKYFTTCN